MTIHEGEKTVKQKLKNVNVKNHKLCESFFFAVPPKPLHLQSPLRAEQAQVHSPKTGSTPPQQVNATEENQSPNRGYGIAVSCISPGQNNAGSPSPLRGRANGPVNGVSTAHVSPVRHTRGILTLSSSPPFGSPSPGKRGLQSHSPIREGGHSPAKLSPRHPSPLATKLRTPSPVQGRVGSYSPAKSSKSWLGLHRGGKMDGQERGAGKSLSVPDLIVYMDDKRLDIQFVCFFVLFICLFLIYTFFTLGLLNVLGLVTFTALLPTSCLQDSC